MVFLYDLCFLWQNSGSKERLFFYSEVPIPNPDISLLVFLERQKCSAYTFYCSCYYNDITMCLKRKNTTKQDRNARNLSDCRFTMVLSFRRTVELMENLCMSVLDRSLDPIPLISYFVGLLVTRDVMVCSHLIYPLSPQVIFEATISEERQGYIALDDIVLLNYPCCKYPFCTAPSLPADLYWAWGKCLAE